MDPDTHRRGATVVSRWYLHRPGSLSRTALVAALCVALSACGGSSTPKHTVSATASTGGTISPAGVTVNDGATASFTVTPDNGYAVAGITGCGGALDGTTYTTGAVTADCTVTASFVTTHTLTAVAAAGGSISPSSATVKDGDSTTVTVTPDSHYVIASVTGCGGSLSDNTYTTDAIAADCTVTARFYTAPVTFSSGQAASVVIGQPDFSSNASETTASGMSSPYGNADVVDGVLYLGDYSNDRVLGFSTIPSTNGASADFVLGATDLSSGGTLGGAQTVAHYGGQLFVALYDDSSVAVYDPIPTADTSAPGAASPEAPSFSITASDVGGLSSPETLAIAAGKLVVTDSDNNRVLIWNTIPTADTAPDLVLGQVDFTGTSSNAGGTATASTFDYPAGVWTDGQRLVVVDENNNRVLIWNTFPTEDGQPADLVLGQTDFSGNSENAGLASPTASTLDYPYDGVYVNGQQLFVADFSNNRVLIWNSWPTSNGQAADVVLGQADFTTNGDDTTASSMNQPTGVFLYGTQLFVTDEGNNRYLLFDGSYQQ
jgi:hypothetical protein